MHEHDHLPAEHLRAALLGQGAEEDWAEKTAKAYAAALLSGDPFKVSRLQLALSSLFRERGYHLAALGILARPSPHAHYDTTGGTH